MRSKRSHRRALKAARTVTLTVALAGAHCSSSTEDLGPRDIGTTVSDSGARDAAPPDDRDSGAPDTGPIADSGARDLGVGDSGDSGEADSGEVDSGEVDSGMADVGDEDAGADADAGDAAIADATPGDAGFGDGRCDRANPGNDPDCCKQSGGTWVVDQFGNGACAVPGPFVPVEDDSAIA